MSNTTNPKHDKLFHKDFTLVLVGQIISLFGNAILRFALPLYLLRTTGSEALFGIVTACSFLPMILLSLLGGILADRVNKRNIMVVLDFSTAAVIIIFNLLLGNVDIVPLFIVTLMILFGIQGTYQPAVQASIPFLTVSENVVSANACINLVSTLSGLLGPIFGGILFSAFGIKPILIISIGCFIFSAVMEIFIKIPYKRQQSSLSVMQLVKSDLSESFRFLRKDEPIMIKVGLLLALFNMIFSALVTIGTPILVTKTLNLTDAHLGYAQASLAAGGLIGGLLMGVIGKKINIRKAYLGLFLSSLCLLPIGASLLIGFSPSVTYIIILASFFISMGIATMFSVLVITYVQNNTPENLIGKVMSTLMAVSMCATPIGSAIYGLLFGLLARNVWILIIGASLISCCLALYSTRVFKQIKTT